MVFRGDGDSRCGNITVNILFPTFHGPTLTVDIYLGLYISRHYCHSIVFGPVTLLTSCR